MTKKRCELDIRAVESEYQPHFDIFTEEDNKTYQLKRIINELNDTDRRIMLMYTELQSQRKLGEALGVSTSTANILVKRIREEIINRWRQLSH